MRLAKGLLILACAGGLTAWLVADGGPRRDGPAVAQRPAVPEPTPVADERFAIETARLARGLTAMPARAATGRDLFRFGPGARGSAGSAPQAAAAEDVGEQAAVEPPPRPALELLGIAEDRATGGGTPARTAVIVSSQQLYLVRVGDQVALRFLVTGIAENAVELKDLAEDSTLRLPLR